MRSRLKLARPYICLLIVSRSLRREILANERQLHDLVDAIMPALLAEPGVGPVRAADLIIAWSHPGRCRSEAAFAALAGVSPLQASSGRITRHRLNRFGDRQLNRALHTIVNWRMIHGHDPTQHYLTRRRAQQEPDAEIRRCLKRYTDEQVSRSSRRRPTSVLISCKAEVTYDPVTTPEEARWRHGASWPPS